jgi:ATP-dependent protease ClpP protease subunit
MNRKRETREDIGADSITIGSRSGVVTWGTGMNLIKITGLITKDELPAVLAMMDECRERAEVVEARRNIGFYLDSDGGPHEVIKQLVAQIEHFRNEHNFHFYVEIKRAASSAVLIVALADEDKRAIESDGQVIIHNGYIQLGLSDFMANGTPNPGHYEKLKQAVEFYKANVWSPTRLDYHKLDDKQKAVYVASDTLKLSAEDCIKMFGFKIKH